MGVVQTQLESPYPEVTSTTTARQQFEKGFGSNEKEIWFPPLCYKNSLGHQVQKIF